MLDAIKELREKTSAGMMDCKRALKEANGDINKAIEILRKKGIALASKKASRTAKDGVIESYIHLGSKIGVLLEVNCESDFVARNKDFKIFVKDVAMQIAASHPRYISKEDVPVDVIEKEKEIIKAQMKGKPENVIEKIAEGKLEKFYEEACLLNQPFIKDMNIKVRDYLTSMVAKIGENIVVRRFTRYQVGEEC
ncbi:MAG: translation elongation factor Ts [Candidatus Omnitrophica bacterium CG07_land_8_20_14_0_80_42_15]|uniref:Elongation factor Ts n=1 Tax=Candidatus Aquitaenariimonas noxiae TaxID=1974741 RepID=A0A2J0KS72_9BACT|nr:MAG: translation elongation factor Ts [Candidatus Omnitrophica bacterium CG07_land_8_20_14_0_80_42_15]